MEGNTEDNAVDLGESVSPPELAPHVKQAFQKVREAMFLVCKMLKTDFLRNLVKDHELAYVMRLAEKLDTIFAEPPYNVRHVGDDENAVCDRLNTLYMDYEAKVSKSLISRGGYRHIFRFVSQSGQ